MAPLIERGDPGQSGSDDESVDLARPLVGEHQLEIVGVPDHRILERDAVCAQYRARFAGNGERLTHVVQLAEAQLLRSDRPLVLHPSEVKSEKRSLVEL